MSSGQWRAQWHSTRPWVRWVFVVIMVFGTLSGALEFASTVTRRHNYPARSPIVSPTAAAAIASTPAQMASGTPTVALIPATLRLSVGTFRHRMNYYLQSHDSLMRLRDCSLANLNGGLCRIGGTASDVIAFAGTVANEHGAVKSAFILVRALQPGSATDRHAALLLAAVSLTQACRMGPASHAEHVFGRVLYEARDTGTANLMVGNRYLQLWHERRHGDRQIGYMVTAER